MKITICQDERSFDVAAAWRIIGQLLEKPDAVIGLSTGATTVNMHDIIAAMHASYPFDVSRVTFFNVDEFINVPADYDGSCYNTIYRHLVGPLGVPAANFIMPPTMSADLDAECRLFEQRLAARGGADLQMLGIGLNGHIGINQPGAPFEGETWVSHLDEDYELRLRRETGAGDDVKFGGLTRGIRNIMQTRRVILVAKGKHKAEIIERAILGPVTTDIPASVIQLHPNCEILLDAEAGARLTGKVKGF